MARKYNRTEVADVLASWGRGGAAAHHNVLSPADKAALDRYQRSFDDDMVAPLRPFFHLGLHLRLIPHLTPPTTTPPLPLLLRWT